MTCRISLSVGRSALSAPRGATITLVAQVYKGRNSDRFRVAGSRHGGEH